MTTTASTILEAAAGHLRDRASTYDKEEAGGERSIGAAVEAFKAVTGDGLLNTAERGWMFMALLKMVRSQQGAYRPDNYEDGTAYSALMGEAAYQAHVAAGQGRLWADPDGVGTVGFDLTVQMPSAAASDKPWYPDDRPGWVEIEPGEAPDVPGHTRVQTLSLWERANRKMIHDRVLPVMEWDFPNGHLCAYRVVDV